MIKSFRRIFSISKRFRGRLYLSQIMMFIAALSTVGYSTLITPLVNEGMVNGNAQEAVQIGIWMLLLAVVMGICMSVAASQAVFFSQGIGYVAVSYTHLRAHETS